MHPSPILPFLLAFAAVPIRVNVSPQEILQTPEAIAPALLPYLACLHHRRGVSLLNVTLDAQIKYDRNDKDCSATRKRSATEAMKLLNGQAPNGTPAATYVEKALSDIDAYAAQLTPRQAREAGSAETLSVSMEDEVKPAYDRYADCLAIQLTNIDVTPQTIMPVFKQVMTICRSVRDAAVLEAANALSKRGWDLPTRTKAAEDTFAAADALWLSIGRRYRDSLFGQPQRSKRHQ